MTKTPSAALADAACPHTSTASPQGPPRRSLALFACALACAAATSACDEQKKTDSLRPSYERPTPPKADAARDLACQARLTKGELSLGKEEAKLRVTAAGLVQACDISVLGGPYEAPLALTLPLGEHVVRTIVDKNGLARCVRVTTSEKPIAKEESVGAVAIDSGTLVLADAARTEPYLRSQPGVLYPGFEGPAGEMEGLAAAVAAQLPTERVLPTFYRGTRPLAPTDPDLIKGAILAGKSHARFMVEPRPPAWALVAALGDGKLLASDHAGERSAVLVDVAAGDGAYVVTAAKDAEGTLVALTVSLER